MATVITKKYADILPIHYQLKDRDRSLDVTTSNEIKTQQGASLVEYDFLTNANDINIKNYTTNILTDTKTESELFDLNFTKPDTSAVVTNIQFANNPRKYLTIRKTGNSLSATADLTPLSSLVEDPSTSQSFVFELSTQQGSSVAKIWTWDGTHKKYLVQRNTIDSVHIGGNTNEPLVFDTVTSANISRAVFNVVYDKNEKLGYLYITPSTNSSTDAFIKTQQVYSVITGRYDDGDFTTLSAVTGFNDTNRLSAGLFKLNHDIIDTDYDNYSNNFVYYKPGSTSIDKVKTLSGQKHNYLLYNNYEENFISAGMARGEISYFNLKNNISNNNAVNKNLPFTGDVQEQRYYNSILNAENSEVSRENLKLGYNFYTAEYEFKPDKYTKFQLPSEILPYGKINLNEAGFPEAGAYAGKSPYFSDRILKLLNDDTNTNKENENNGSFLCSWLYDDSEEGGNGFWYDRYYLPARILKTQALEGNLNQTIPHRTEIETMSGLAGFKPNAVDLNYYDVPSTLMLEPNGCYYYARIGKTYARKVLNGVADRLVKDKININTTDKQAIMANQDRMLFNGKNYDEFTFPLILNSDQGSLTVAFDLNIPDLKAFKAYQVIGNSYNTGLKIAKNFYYAPTIIIPDGSQLKYYDNDFTLIKTNDFSSELSQITDVLYVSQLQDIVILGKKADTTGIAIRVNFNGDIIRSSDNSLVNQLVNSNYVSRVCHGLSPKASFASGNESFLLDLANLVISIDTPPKSESLILSGANGDITVAGIDGFKGVNVDDTFAISLSSIPSGSGSTAGSSIYFTEYSTGVMYEGINTINKRISDINAFDGKIFAQVTDSVYNKLHVYNTDRELLSTVQLSTSAVSGFKIDFISDDYEIKPIVFSLNSSGNILVDKISTVGDTIKVDHYDLGHSTVNTFGTFSNYLSAGIRPGHFISPTNLHCLEDQYRYYEDKLCIISNFDNNELFQDTLPPWDTYNSAFSALTAGNWSVNFASALGVDYDNSTIQIIDGVKEGHNCIQLAADFVTGECKVYLNGKKTTDFAITTNVKALKNFLFNNYYIGVPNFSYSNTTDYFTNNVGLAKNAVMGGLKIFDEILSHDLLKFLYINCTPTIDSIRYDIPVSTRNNTETINNFYSYKIPGSTSNKIKLYIKNGNLSVSDQAIITSILKKKIAKYLPATINVEDVEIDYRVGNQQPLDEEAVVFLSPRLPLRIRNRIPFSNNFDYGATFAFEITTEYIPVLFDRDGSQSFVMVV